MASIQKFCSSYLLIQLYFFQISFFESFEQIELCCHSFLVHFFHCSKNVIKFILNNLNHRSLLLVHQVIFANFQYLTSNYNTHPSLTFQAYQSTYLLII